MLGSAADCNDKLYALKQVSEKLTGMKGTLHLENYDGTTASIILRKKIRKAIAICNKIIE